jgi:hypothetical protein
MTFSKSVMLERSYRQHLQTGGEVWRDWEYLFYLLDNALQKAQQAFLLD